jgi:hypothetical protein
MATDPVTGEWTPDRVIKNRQRYADLLLGQQARSPLEGLVRGLGGGYFSGQADQYERDNQALEKQSLAGLLGAKTQDDLIRGFAASKVPHHQQQGLGILSQSLDPARKLQMETGQEALAHARSMHPLERQAKEAAIAEGAARNPLERRKLEAETKALEQKDAINEAIAARLRAVLQRQQGQPPPQTAPAPAIPGYQPIPPNGPRRPASADVAPGDPNLIHAQAPGAAPQAPTQAPVPPQDLVDVPLFGKIPREEARELGGALIAGGRAELGKMLIEAAGGASEGFGKEGRNKIDEKTINAVNHVSRLREVSESFDPKYLQIPTRIKMAWTSLKSKFGDLKPEEAAEIAPFAEFRRRTVENMSRLLNELSGAAISPQEYERIRQTQPDAGTGMTDGDGPQEFEAKMKGAIRSQMRAIARYNYLRTHSPQTLSNPKDLHNAFPLEEIDKVINKRGAEINQQLRQQFPGASPAVIDQQRRAILANEFGIQI